MVGRGRCRRRTAARPTIASTNDPSPERVRIARASCAAEHFEATRARPVGVPITLGKRYVRTQGWGGPRRTWRTGDLETYEERYWPGFSPVSMSCIWPS